MNQLFLHADVDSPCSFYGYKDISSFPPVSSQRIMTLDEPSYIWTKNGMMSVPLGSHFTLITDMWCNGEPLGTYVNVSLMC